MDYVNPSSLYHHNNGVGSSQYYDYIDNPPVHPGAKHAPMPQYHTLLDQRRIEHVPRPIHFSPSYESIPAITFSAKGWAGVRVKDILKNTVVIDSPNDQVFAEHGWRTIVVNLEWPGYVCNTSSNPMVSRIDVCPGGRHITRQTLAREVCGLLFSFHQIIFRYPISPGWERWAMAAGPEGIRVTDIVLLSIHYYRNVWVPEFYVIE